jgi:acetyl-CoA acetyltransferase
MAVTDIGAAIVGIGMTEVGPQPERTSLGLAADALQLALADAGLQRSDIDGISWNLGRPLGEDYDRIVDALGLRVRFVSQSWTHGRFTGTMLTHAALAVANDLADFVACLGGVTWNMPTVGSEIPNIGDYRRYGMAQFDVVALAYQRYLYLTGSDPDRLADVALTFRRHAALNPAAMYREPLSREQYLANPKVLDPLRELDTTPLMHECHYGVCVILARAEVAATMRKPPVHVVAAQGMRGGPEEAYLARPGLGIFTQTDRVSLAPTADDLAIYDVTGLTPRDMDGFFTYDNFANFVWYALERYGYCEPGEAHKWATEERMSLGGELPVNTNGGNLSAGHTSGWSHVVEMVRQLRHECGDRQISDARILHWATVYGDSIVLANEWLKPVS